MNRPRISRLEKEITRLPSEEQRWLVDRLTHRLRSSPRLAETNENSLAAMAADSEVIRELRTIDEDFRATESDGLGNTWWPSAGSFLSG